MRKLRTILLIIGIVALVGSGLFFALGYLKPTSAGISIESNPKASVFIRSAGGSGSEEVVGRTPYEKVLDPGDYIVKLIPESDGRALAPYETKVSLASGIQTVIRRDFGETEAESEGDVVSFEKVGGDQTSLAVVSIPDAAQISLDGSVRGFAPIRTDTVSSGEHLLVVSAEGYKDRVLQVNPASGYNLTVVVKLAPDKEAAQKTTAEEQEQKVKPLTIKIGETPSNFLRVRSEPATIGEELGRVTPGDTYEVIEKDEKSGWYKIEYEKGKEGWVSGDFVEEVKDTEASPSPSPSGSPKPSPSPTF